MAGFDIDGWAHNTHPDHRDGKAAAEIVPPKSNWALPIDEPPCWPRYPDD